MGFRLLCACRNLPWMSHCALAPSFRSWQPYKVVFLRDVVDVVFAHLFGGFDEQMAARHGGELLSSLICRTQTREHFEG